MTRLFNDPAAFADEMTEGFVASHRRWVRRVPGGVARRTATREGVPALVVGGGSGHYPAFAGLVGPGLAHGAAMGNLFASPSAQQVYSVAKAVEAGGGVLLAYGNYAGDVLHFTQAQGRLQAEGIECVSIAVTDDVSSASPDERHKRRGIAGDLTVFKVAGAAAEEGRNLAEVEALAVRANERTRSLGVAFTGCTLPGARQPLFTVPAGRMAVGMGIHGEPGIDERDVPPADELAELLVSRLLEEVPDGVVTRGARVVPILNGLGGVKYEELFVVYRRVDQLLADAGIQAVDPQVGELVTSFDMAGASLTLFWLDEELERLWLAPVDAPSFRRGSVETVGEVLADQAAGAAAAVPPSSSASREAASRILAGLEAARATIDANAEELGRIDSIAGDGDHGIGMQRGVHAAAEAATNAAARGAGAGTALAWAGDAWADRAGGTSGALWGLALRTLGEVVGDDDAPDASTVAAGVTAAADAIVAFGKAQVGDKTLVDALLPFSRTLSERVGTVELADAWGEAATAAERAAEGTADLLPRLGRARPHAEKSLGTPDAGAVSLALVVRAIHTTLTPIPSTPKEAEV